MDTREDMARAERAAFGGYDAGASFFGWLVATAVASLLTALLSAIGVAALLTRSVPITPTALRTTGWLAALLWLVALAVAYYAGGYVAGRMARFDGGRQGFGVWVTSLVAIVVLGVAAALFGSGYNLLGSLNLPRLPISEGTLSWGGIITLVLALGVSLVAAMSGAKTGENYHRKIERFEAATAQPVRETRPSASRAQPTFGERISRRDDPSEDDTL